MDFNIVHLVISVRTNDVRQLCLRLPLSGNEFSSACRITACRWPARGCGSCSMGGTCAWKLVFGQKLSSDPSALKRFQKPPLPFMFTFPSPNVHADNTTVIECGLVVIGQAIACLDMLLDGFREILLSLDADMLMVGTRDYQSVVHPLGDGMKINCPENMAVLSVNDVLENRIWMNARLHIRLVSPLRLFADGRLLATFDFSRFARSLLRRVSSLAYYYGMNECAYDYKELSRQADAVICTDTHFTLATGKSRKMTGLMGQGSYQGDFSGLLPFLAAGVYVHAGKGASFGMGVYELLE